MKGLEAIREFECGWVVGRSAILVCPGLMDFLGYGDFSAKNSKKHQEKCNELVPYLIGNGEPLRNSELAVKR